MRVRAPGMQQATDYPGPVAVTVTVLVTVLVIMTVLVIVLVIVAVLVTVVYSGIMTFVLLKIVDMVMGLRVSAQEERIGLDLTQHRESSYTLID